MDIDIDISKNVSITNIFNTVIASTIEDGVIKKHLVGHYFQNIPKDEQTGLAAIPYKDAEKFGYTKIDFLHLTLLDIFSGREELEALLAKEPNWKLLENEDIVKELFHISKHFGVVEKVKPKSVEDLADILALIRPNKVHLLDKYLQNKESVRKVLYHKIDASDLRKSHAIAYALNIKLQLNYIEYNETIKRS